MIMVCSSQVKYLSNQAIFGQTDLLHDIIGRVIEFTKENDCSHNVILILTIQCHTIQYHTHHTIATQLGENNGNEAI